MSSDENVRVRPGAIRGTRSKIPSFAARALVAANAAGGLAKLGQAKQLPRRGFGRGRAMALAAQHRFSPTSRNVVVKARIVRHRSASANLKTHVRYLEREGVTRDGERAQLFGPGDQLVDGSEFANTCSSDRHHFRFIVAPEEAEEIGDLKVFTRDLMRDAERDLGTRLEWAAVDHWNTEHPHVHVLVRGRTDTGEDLVISRDYIRSGLRARASHRVTLELGPRTAIEIERSRNAEVAADRFTRLDRNLLREAEDNAGVIDVRPDIARRADPDHRLKVARLRKLARLGLAEETKGRWTIRTDAEEALRALGERDDIIKRLHRSANTLDRSVADDTFVLAGENASVVGRFVARGLDDELAGSAFAIIDGTDGRLHHIRLPSLEAATDAPTGAIVELRKLTTSRGTEIPVLAVRSDLDVHAQITADGATWLDRRLIRGDVSDLPDRGFGKDVRQAAERRIDHLAENGLARRAGHRVILARNLLATLRRRELQSTARAIEAETGKTFRELTQGEHVRGTHARTLRLASGRYALIEDGVSLSLVPATPKLERQIDGPMLGIVRADGMLELNAVRQRGLSR